MGYGDWIRRERKRLKLTQRELGQRIGATDGYISHLEKGLKVPSLELAMAMAEVFGFSLDEQHRFLEAVDAARVEQSRRRIERRGEAVRGALRVQHEIRGQPVLKVVDLQTAQQLHSVHPETLVCSLAFAPDSRMLAAGGEDGTVTIWDTRAGGLQRRLTCHDGSVNAVAYSPDGRSLATGGDDATVKLWDAATGAVQRILSGHSDRVSSISWAPDGRTLVSASADGTVRLWDVETGTARHTISPETGRIRVVVFSPDGRMLASGDDAASLWDVASGDLLRTLRGHTGSVHSIAFAANGSTVATVGEDEAVRFWDVSLGRELRELRVMGGTVAAAGFLPDESTLVTAFRSGAIQLWDMRTGRLQRTISGEVDTLLTVAVTRDGRILGIGGASAAAQEAPVDVDHIAQELEADPQLAAAYRDLVAAYSNREFRDTVLKTLRALAQQAGSQ